MIQKRLFIVSNSLPLQISKEDGIVISTKCDAIADSISSYIKENRHSGNTTFCETYWAGVARCSSNEWTDATRDLSEYEFKFLPVFINKRVYGSYHDGFATSFLWPLFHEYSTSFILQPADFDNYLSANNEFLNAIFKYLLPNDVVWIQGYHLMPLASIIRRAFPEITIAYSMHIPFPSFSVLKVLPGSWLETLMMGVLGADMISFSSWEYGFNFLEAIQKTMFLDCDNNIIRYNNRLIRINTFPADDKCDLKKDPSKIKISSLNDHKLKLNELNTPQSKNEIPAEENGLENNPEYEQPWVKRHLSQLDQIKKQQQEFQIKFLDESTKRNIFDQYRISKKRLIFLDYDGTLVAYFPLPLQANPSEQLVELLRKLSSSEKNEIFIISGRDADSLESWMGFLPLNIIAEHGARIKMKHREWEVQTLARSDWKTPVKDIMQEYVIDCPNSFIEEKQFSMVWHYRNASEDKILNRSGELAAVLREYGSFRGLQVVSGNKIVEVRNYGIDKGTAVKKIITATTYDFILAAGDDKTDEDMFRVLSDNPDAITIKIGGDASYAKYNLHTPQMAISLLEAISNF